ncbi:MAG TPA: SRPBCC family protein [Egibacteraceae bacterium]|nr:SRPBCC family protein [Egibacteraceae bacterium]
MRLDHSFTVPVSVDDAWAVLGDMHRVASCMPGAVLDDAQDGRYRGRIRLKLGPMVLTYRGEAQIVSADESAHRMQLSALGKETRGGGTAKADVTVELRPVEPTLTEVTAVTELDITGKPAQFGRGVLEDVSSQLMQQFADRLSQELSGSPRQTAAAASAGSPEAGRTVPHDAAPDEGDDLLDLLSLAGVPAVKRALVAAGAALGLVLLVIIAVRRRGSSPTDHGPVTIYIGYPAPKKVEAGSGSLLVEDAQY